MALRWRGDEVLDVGERAVKNGMDETMAEAVGLAKDRVHVVTSILQGSIQFRPAQRAGDRIVGRWGSSDVNYAAIEELRPGHEYLRPSADAAHPRLAARI